MSHDNPRRMSIALAAVSFPLFATHDACARTAALTNLSNAFNPAMSLILDGTFAGLSRDPEDYALAGFALGEESGPGEKGFSLGESELAISANIDDRFFGNANIALTPDGEAEVEQAYFQTLSLGAGLTLRAGRFFSGVGYLNEHHAHAWDFADQPLVYRAMLGNQFRDDGVQARWVAPTELFVELGAEIFRGDSFPAGGAASSGAGTRSVFAHVGGDVGDSHSWRAGASYLMANAEERESEEGANVFGGDSDLAVIDFVWKWAPQGNSTNTNLKVQAELFLRNEDGVFNDAQYSGDQRGAYAQLIYQFMPAWRAGVRYDRLMADAVPATLAGTVLDDESHDPTRMSLMVDYSHSEFSRLRLQYNRDESRPVVDDQWFVQYVMSIGAHGAHLF